MDDNAQEFYVYNPVKQNKGIGRRTGKPVYKKRNIYNGADNFDDYLTDSDDEASINVTKNLPVSAADSSQTLKGVLSSGKTGATKARELSLREDAAAKSIHQLPPERFDNMRIVNPLILGSRFGRRTGKDVLTSKALAGGLEDFSAFLSDNTDISMSMQATPSPCAPEKLLPSLSARKSISSSKKSRNRTQVLFHNSFHRTRPEIPSILAVSSEKRCSLEVHQPSFEEQGISYLHVPECIIPAVVVEHEDLAHKDTSLNNARSRGIVKGSTTENSLQRSAENSSSRANLNTSEVKDVHHNKQKACMIESMSKATQARQEQKNLNTSEAKNVSQINVDIEKTCMSESMSKVTQAWPQKENLNISQVKNVRHDNERACMRESMSRATQTGPQKEHLNTSKVKSTHNEDEKTQLDLSKATQTRPEKEHLSTSKVKNVRHDERACMSESMFKATQTGPQKEHLNTSKVKSTHNEDEKIQLDLSKAAQTRPEKEHLGTSEVTNVRHDDERACMSESMSRATQAGLEKENLNTSKVRNSHNEDEQRRLGLSMTKATQAVPEKTHLPPESDKQVSRFDKTEEIQTSCRDSENSNLGKKDETEIHQHSSTEESTKSVLDGQRVQMSQASAVKQVQHLDSSKGNKTKSGQSSLAQSSDAQEQERNDISGNPECVVASQATSCGQKSSIAVASVHVASISDIDMQGQSENSLQTTGVTGQQGASKHMIKSSSALNFGGDITGSVSRTEQAAGGQFFGIKKRLSFSHALLEVEKASVKCMKKAETSRLTKAVPREKKSIGSFLGEHDTDNTDHQKTVSKTGTFVTLAASRISQLTSEAQLLRALNTSTDSHDDFCIVEEENIVFDLSEVANKHHNKADKKQRKDKRNGKSSSAKQEAIDKTKQQTVYTDNQREGVYLQGKDSLQEENQVTSSLNNRKNSLLEGNQVTNSLNNRKNRKCSRTVLDAPDTYLEAQTFISLTSQKVTDMTANRRKEGPGDNISKRKVKHSMKDEASPPKQIRGDEEQDADTDILEIDIDSEVLNSTKVSQLKVTNINKTKCKKKVKSVDLQLKQLKENNNVSNTNEKQSNLSQEAGDKKKNKVRKKVNVQEKLDAAKNSSRTPPEENNALADLSAKQNNQLKKGEKGSKTFPSKSDKFAEENKEESLPKELKLLKDKKLPNLRRAQLHSRSIVLGSECSSDNSSFDRLQQENVIPENPATETITENIIPIQINSQRYSIRSRQTSKLGQHPAVTQSSQKPSVTQSSQEPSVTQSSQKPSVTQSSQKPSVTQSSQEPSVTQSSQKPSVTQSSQKPSVTQSSQKLSVTQSSQKPSVTQSSQKPSVTQSSQKPSVTKSSQKPSVTQSSQEPSVTQSSRKPSVTQSSQKPSVTQSEHYKQTATESQKAKVGKKAKHKLKGNGRNKTGKGRQNRISGKRTKATNIQKKRKLSRLATNFSVIYESITEEGSCVSDINFNNPTHSIVEVSNYNLSVDKHEIEGVSKNRKEKVKNVKNTTLDKPCTENCIDIQTSLNSQTCDVNQIGHPSTGKNSDRSKSVDVSVPVELLENNQRSLSRKSVSSKVRQAVKTAPRNKSMHSESRLEDCSPPKLQLMSSLPNVTPRSGISFRRSRCLSSKLSDAGSCSPATAPTRDEECFTPHLKEQKTPAILSCLKNAESSVKPRRKGRRVRISSIIDQRECSPFENDVCDSPSLATTSLLSVNSSPVHYGETTTNNIDFQSGSTQVILPDLSYKIIRPETSHVQGLRRSARTRVLRLNSHKGEEIIYRRDSTGFGLLVDSIQPSVGEAKVKAAEERRRKRLKQRQLRAMNVPAKPAKRLSTHWKVDDMITSTNEVHVINPDTNEPVLLELIARSDSATWYGPDLDPITGTEPVALCLHLKQQMFTTGEMNMRALAEKPSEYTEHTLILYVICGKILLRISSVSTIVDTGDSFFIPRGTSYSIKNLRREIAKLYFVDLDDNNRGHNFTQDYSMSGTSDQTGNR